MAKLKIEMRMRQRRVADENGGLACGHWFSTYSLRFVSATTIVAGSIDYCVAASAAVRLVAYNIMDF